MKPMLSWRETLQCLRKRLRKESASSCEVATTSHHPSSLLPVHFHRRCCFSSFVSSHSSILVSFTAWSSPPFLTFFTSDHKPSTMRLLPFLALTGSALAQEGMMDKVTNWGGNLQRQLVNAFTNPIDSAAAAIAGAVVQPLNMQNWKSHLMPKDGQPEEWMVYMTGRNKTCYGRCDHSDRTWNVRLPSCLILHLPTA